MDLLCLFFCFISSSRLSNLKHTIKLSRLLLTSRFRRYMVKKYIYKGMRPLSVRGHFPYVTSLSFSLVQRSIDQIQVDECHNRMSEQLVKGKTVPPSSIEETIPLDSVEESLDSGRTMPKGALPFCCHFCGHSRW